MNNTAILKKCLDELNKEDFRKDYVVGMLETLIELQEVSVSDTKTFNYTYKAPATTVTLSAPANDEASILDARARAAIEAVKDSGQTE